MPVFYYHPVNRIPQILSEMTNVRGFTYLHRGELELTIQNQLIKAGMDVDPRFHTVVGTLAGPLNYHIALNPDNELDRHTLKLCKSNTSWSYLKILNGKTMSFIMGYVSSAGGNPFGMSTVGMAQSGLIQVSHVPRLV